MGGAGAGAARRLRLVRASGLASLARTTATATTTTTPQNLIERIVQRYAVGLAPGQAIAQGDFVSISPEHVMTHDNTAAVISKFKSIGAKRFHRPTQPVFTLDHDVQNKSEKNLEKYRTIESFGKANGIDFYPAGRGIGHQIVVEEGYAFPYTMTVASDSHSNMYGGIGALGTPIVRTDAAAIWATGQTWWQVPPVAKVELLGKLPKGSSGKDIIVALCGLLNKDEVLNHAVEFTGADGIRSLSVDERLTIANMTTEWGALAGVFPVDEQTLSFLEGRLKRLGPNHSRIHRARIDDLAANPIVPHPDAYYSKVIQLDLSRISPHVSGPNSVKVARPVHDFQSGGAVGVTKVDKAYLLSCTNSRASDLREAAAIIRGKKIAEGVEFYVAAASSEVQRDAEVAGDWQALLDAGATPLPAGCGPCIGLGVGLLKDNEVGISATNRNFKGRMGSRSAYAYLASPAVVAASALAGKITSPDLLASPSGALAALTPSFTVHTVEKRQKAPAPTASGSSDADATIPGFPARHRGELVFCDADNLDTDGIYPGSHTYREDVSKEEMAQVAMKNYDPTFSANAKLNDVLVSGFNFGTGSSREQAATCLLHAGVRLIVVGSLSETYKRNAINNGLLCLECPDLVADLRALFAADADGADGKKKLPTRRTGWTVEVDFVRGAFEIVAGAGAAADGGAVKKSYAVPVVGKAAQELVVAGGLEAWVKQRI
ncbi:Homoaconitase, catalyzes the conversion of homocitrate to homoisocitrate, which is a step in the lys [Zopfochytrium polystomum]|nr:Homoaconitase, catalyzes the conversion of homocitrate to homoisocitrate, which is a step in the lys [Zopfochytrium polystomum]